MTLHLLGSLICRSFALYYFLHTIQLVTQLLPMLYSNPPVGNYAAVWAFINVLSYFMFAVFLWIFADKMGRRLTKAANHEIHININQNSALQLLFIGFGLMVLGHVLQDVPHLFQASIRHYKKTITFHPMAEIRALIILAQIIIGFVCIFQSRLLSAWVLKTSAKELT